MLLHLQSVQGLCDPAISFIERVTLCDQVWCSNSLPTTNEQILWGEKFSLSGSWYIFSTKYNAWQQLNIGYSFIGLMDRQDGLVGGWVDGHMDGQIR